MTKDELARLVLDLEDYDVPRTGSKEEYPNLTIGIGDSTDLFVLTPTMPGTDMSLEASVFMESLSIIGHFALYFFRVLD